MVNVVLPAKNVLQATDSAAVRMGLSNRQHLTIIASTINAGNQSALTDFSLSLGLMNRAGGIHEDQIAIFISPPPKLLTIPFIARSTGAAQAEAVLMLRPNDFPFFLVFY